MSTPKHNTGTGTCFLHAFSFLLIDNCIPVRYRYRSVTGAGNLFVCSKKAVQLRPPIFRTFSKAFLVTGIWYYVPVIDNGLGYGVALKVFYMFSRKRHSGDRTAPEPNPCLGVFGLSLYTTEKELEKVSGIVRHGNFILTCFYVLHGLES
jgi:hypothetical protein